MTLLLVQCTAGSVRISCLRRNTARKYLHSYLYIFNPTRGLNPISSCITVSGIHWTPILWFFFHWVLCQVLQAVICYTHQVLDWRMLLMFLSAGGGGVGKRKVISPHFWPAPFPIFKKILTEPTRRLTRLSQPKSSLFLRTLPDEITKSFFGITCC